MWDGAVGGWVMAGMGVRGQSVSRGRQKRGVMGQGRGWAIWGGVGHLDLSRSTNA